MTGFRGLVPSCSVEAAIMLINARLHLRNRGVKWGDDALTVLIAAHAEVNKAWEFGDARNAISASVAK